MEETPAFTYGQKRIRTFIKKQIVTGDKEDTLLKIEHGKIKPSKQLQDALVKKCLKEIKNSLCWMNKRLYMKVFLSILVSVKKDGKKRTIIVEGSRNRKNSHCN